ncbi:hypothetical protein X777_08973 [Ooceraea biroi]|uniref:Uncharacterized protein n=1 Tax=Ooceraea biroi TaxID=2015173 RepID=A0A026W8K3_OOCBI|nr:hypothetical protein X777_08973 [Ooceraea biroi]
MIPSQNPGIIKFVLDLVALFFIYTLARKIYLSRKLIVAKKYWVCNWHCNICDNTRMYSSGNEFLREWIQARDSKFRNQIQVVLQLYSVHSVQIGLF